MARRLGQAPPLASSSAAPHVDHPAAPKDSSAAGGRDENGRFAKGNPGGPGNPFAREVAKLRRAFMNRVSVRDLEDIADKMVALAKDGNVQAAKFIYSYMIGKPLPARDPDHLNEHESEVFQSEAKITQEVAPVPEQARARGLLDAGPRNAQRDDPASLRPPERTALLLAAGPST
jgi:hypothetical protein